MATALFSQRQIAVVAYRGDDDHAPAVVYDRDSFRATRRPYSLLFVSTVPPLDEFARTVKEAGWEAALLAVASCEPLTSWPFEAIIQANGMEQALQLAANSCTGMLAVPSGSPIAPALGDLAELRVPLAILSITGNEHRVVLPHVAYSANLAAACAWLSSQCSDAITETAESLIEKGLALRGRNYPHGEDGAYLAAAELFRAATLKAKDNQKEIQGKAIVLFLEACGDHAYYHKRDFLVAGSFYSHGVQYLLDPAGIANNDLRKALYLKAIMAESVGLGLADVGEDALARQMALDAIVRYRQASHYASAETISCYRHTITGLTGWAQLLLAKQYLAAGHLAVAEASLREAKAEYDEAIQHQPLWRTSGFSDHYDNALHELQAVESTLHELRRDH